MLLLSQKATACNPPVLNLIDAAGPGKENLVKGALTEDKTDDFRDLSGASQLNQSITKRLMMSVWAVRERPGHDLWGHCLVSERNQ